MIAKTATRFIICLIGIIAGIASVVSYVAWSIGAPNTASLVEEIVRSVLFIAGMLTFFAGSAFIGSVHHTPGTSRGTRGWSTKLIYLNSAGIDEKINDQMRNKFPWELEVLLNWPQFHGIVYVMRFGGREELVVRFKTRKALDRFLRINDLMNHPRLDLVTIRLHEGKVESIDRRSLANANP